jgi:hypothetical protein
MRRIMAMGSVCLLALPARAQPQAPPVGLGAPANRMSSDEQLEARFRADVLRAQQLMRLGRRNEALGLLQGAYSLRQEPALLLDIARLLHQLGLGAEAIAAYQRYLIADPGAPADLRGEATAAIAQISALMAAPTTAPTGAPTPAAQAGPTTTPAMPATPPPSILQSEPVVSRRSRHKGMIAAGWTLLSVGYAGAFATGVAMGASWGSPCYMLSGYYCQNPSPAAGWTLLIPILGPVISSVIAPATTKQAVSYGLAWDLPWLLTDLPLQLVGLGLIIQGYKTPQLFISRKLLSQVQIRPYSSPGGGGMIASGTF